MAVTTEQRHDAISSAARRESSGGGSVLPSAAAINPGASATLNAQFWFERFPWRPTAAWAVVAGFLALGYPFDHTGAWVNPDWRTVALLLLLVDPLWGSIWRLASGRDEMLPLHSQIITQRFWLPYLQANSPAAQLMGRGATGDASGYSVFPLIFRVVIPTLLLSCAVALVLGLSAFWMTVAVAMCSLLGWISRRTWQRPLYLLHALVTVALPWGVTLQQLGQQLGATSPALTAPDVDVRWSFQIALLALWTLHNWGEGRCLAASGGSAPDRMGMALLGAADVGIGVLLVAARAPLWLAFVCILWLPTWLSLYRGYSLQRVSFWWLFTMLVSAIALGQ